MLPLDGARWRELTQAYGSAEDVPRLIGHLALVSEEARRELWVGLWSTLCHQGDVYDASYAAVPHLVAFAEGRPAHERAESLHLVGAIEVGRLSPAAPPVPGDLAASYRDALAAVPALVAGCVGERWDADTTQILASVLAIAKGHPRFGNAALGLEAAVACPVCGAAHPPAGWDFDGDG
ncbi:MAG: hypothetical protein ACJ79S_20975 [Gemmatimonadaceae bacterium]